MQRELEVVALGKMVKPRNKGTAMELLAPTAVLGGGARVSRTLAEL
jgi:hypothetical protein